MDTGDLLKRIERLAEKSAGENKESVQASPKQKEPVENEVPKSQIVVTNTARQLDIFAKETIRPELNIAKFADFIFTSPYSKAVYDTRKKEFPVFVDGEEMPGSVLIEPLKGHKTPTVTTYKYFLALIQLWEEKGKPPSGTFEFSAIELVSILGHKWGGTVAKQVERELLILDGCKLTWAWGFLDTKKRRQRLVHRMNIINELSYITQDLRLKKEKFAVLHRITLHPLITENLVAGNTKPLNFQTFLSITDEGAASLYTHLDIVLADKTYWERRAVGLLNDLSVSGKRYESKRARKALVLKWIDRLHDKELFHGRLKLAIAETSDKQDWKLVARKVPRVIKKRAPKATVNNKAGIDVLVDDLTLAAGQGDTHQGLYTLFAKFYSHQLIHRAISEMKADTTPRSKGKMLTAIIHRLSHEQGLDWIKKCSADCKFRPENKPPLL